MEDEDSSELVVIESGSGKVSRPVQSLEHQPGQGISTESSSELQITDLEHLTTDSSADSDLCEGELLPDEASDVPMTTEDPRRDKWASLPCRDHPAQA